MVWATEFGRTPGAENSNGRDHHPFGFSTWMAGGGIKGGIIHGCTDEIGFHAVENRHYVTDIHATILHQLGLDPKKLDVPGRKATGHRLRHADQGNSGLACWQFWRFAPASSARLQPWTVDAILNIPTLGDPQIRPDGRQIAYVRRSLDGKSLAQYHVCGAPIPAGAAAGNRQGQPSAMVSGFEAHGIS